ncbi:MAG: hypothetical protein K8L99_33005 [Anaerolineae bacterium]|nr:hypothetical protein [Anaerolineae bacterium]
MKDLINISVYIPEFVKEGLSGGIYERVGGVIRNTANKNVVCWLRDAVANQSHGYKNIISKFPLGTATIVGAAFMYLERNFGRIHEQLNSLDKKLDAQNLSKVQSGFGLAIEAERSLDLSDAKMGMNSAIVLLEEGKNIFKNLLKDIGPSDAEYVNKTFGYARLVVCTQLCKARAYLWRGDYSLARHEVEDLRLFVRNMCKTYRGYSEWRLDKRDSIAGPIRDHCFGKYPNEELPALLDLAEYLTGYLLEIDALQKRGILLKDIDNELFLGRQIS